MPVLIGGEWYLNEGETDPNQKPRHVRAEDKPGHRPLHSYKLPKWCYHPGKATSRIIIEKSDYTGMASDGNRNYEDWNVAHVAAYHDDLKLLSLATIEQCKEPNRWGMTPAHMCGMGQHHYGPSLAVLYELVQLGVADPEAVNHADQTPWHICQRMQKQSNLKKFEKVLLKGAKPDHYDEHKEAQLRPRGKFARELGLDVAEKDRSGSLPVCLLLPGQGSQYVGMMQAASRLPAVQVMLEKARTILNYDIMDVMLTGPEEKLASTKFCQPAMYIANLAAIEQLKADEPEKFERCQAIAGLSVGEYAALTAAGVFDFETGLKIVKARAEAMDFEATRPDSKKQGMVVVVGLERDVIERIIREASAERKGETCQISGYLFPKAFTVAGSEFALQSAERKASEAGALQVRSLKVSSAYHTPAMLSVRDYLLPQLDNAKANMKPPRCKVYMNSTAKAIGPDTPVKDIIKQLGEQLLQPVLWEQSVQQAIRDGCTEFYECGPSRQLRGMLNRIDPKMADKMSNVSV